MNEVATRNTGAVAGAFNPFAQVAKDMGASEIGDFLKFNGKNGDYTYGKEENELPLGDRLIVDTTMIERGWICWVDEKVVEEEMTNIWDGNPLAEEDLTDHGPYKTHADGTADGWSEQARVDFYLAEDGVKLIFKTTSKSGTKALANLIRDIGRGYQRYPNMWPVIELDNTNFIPKNNKKVGKVYAPIFKIVDWMSIDDAKALIEGAAAAAAGDKDAGPDNPDNYADADDAAQAEDSSEAVTETPREERRPAPAAQGRRNRPF